MPTMGNKTKITVECIVNSSLEKVWDYWTTPKYIEQWNIASPDWHTPKAVNNLTVGGKYIFTMAAKDGSMSFDLEGTYTNITKHKSIKSTLADGRTVSVDFIKHGDNVKVVETFEAEAQNPIEMQRQGWQNILDNFKKLVENH